MTSLFSLLVLSSVATAKIVSNLKSSVPADSRSDPLDGFVSFSIEFASFPDFAGNLSNPNKFSNNLLNNLGYLTGTKPYIRVGGSTQDFAIYNPELTYALNGTINVTRSADFPTTIEIGPSYFESYLTFPNVKFTHGFNMGGNHDSRQWDTLLQTVPIVCKTLGKERLNWWEYGNEPDLFPRSRHGPVRPSNYTEADYVEEWLTATRAIKDKLAEACPELLSDESFGFFAPSFASPAVPGTPPPTTYQLKGPVAWAEGLNTDKNVRLFAAHNYIAASDTPGVTLQATLMNHTGNRISVDRHIEEFAQISAAAPKGFRQIMGETNSLARQGLPGVSNSFGAALWGIDFNLYCASVGIGRVHMHMGTNYRYASWQPKTTDLAPAATRPPYYGNVAVAAFLGNLRIEPVRVTNLALTRGSRGHQQQAEPEVGVQDAAYAAYVGNELARVMVLNLRAYNFTRNGSGDIHDRNPARRPVRTYSFDVDGLKDGREAVVRRLYAQGSDMLSGITWDGISYNYELDLGKPVRMRNVTIGEKVKVRRGVVEVDVPDSQAVILDFGSV
ncbi:glycoside hydrolase family 79 protein [Xylaria palmicola]|nr:glycoside hydrolase family 79 protein [Xylaria palmicola]